MHESFYFAFALEPVCFISNPEIRIDRKCHSEAAGHCITSKGLKGTDGYLALTSPSSWSIDFSPQRPSLKSIYLIRRSFEHFFRSLYSYLLFCLSLLWFLHKVQYLAGCPLTSTFSFVFFLPCLQANVYCLKLLYLFAGGLVDLYMICTYFLDHAKPVL